MAFMEKTYIRVMVGAMDTRRPHRIGRSDRAGFEDFTVGKAWEPPSSGRRIIVARPGLGYASFGLILNLRT